MKGIFLPKFLLTIFAFVVVISQSTYAMNQPQVQWGVPIVDEKSKHAEIKIALEHLKQFAKGEDARLLSQVTSEAFALKNVDSSQGRYEYTADCGVGNLTGQVKICLKYNPEYKIFTCDGMNLKTDYKYGDKGGGSSPSMVTLEKKQPNATNNLILFDHSDGSSGNVVGIRASQHSGFHPPRSKERDLLPESKSKYKQNIEAASASMIGIDSFWGDMDPLFLMFQNKVMESYGPLHNIMRDIFNAERSQTNLSLGTLRAHAKNLEPLFREFNGKMSEYFKHPVSSDSRIYNAECAVTMNIANLEKHIQAVSAYLKDKIQEQTSIQKPVQINVPQETLDRINEEIRQREAARIKDEERTAAEAKKQADEQAAEAWHTANSFLGRTEQQQAQFLLSSMAAHVATTGSQGQGSDDWTNPDHLGWQSQQQQTEALLAVRSQPSALFQVGDKVSRFLDQPHQQYFKPNIEEQVQPAPKRNPKRAVPLSKKPNVENFKEDCKKIETIDFGKKPVDSSEDSTKTLPVEQKKSPNVEPLPSGLPTVPNTEPSAEHLQATGLASFVEDTSAAVCGACVQAVREHINAKTYVQPHHASVYVEGIGYAPYLASGCGDPIARKYAVQCTTDTQPIVKYSTAIRQLHRLNHDQLPDHRDKRHRCGVQQQEQPVQWSAPPTIPSQGAPAIFQDQSGAGNGQAAPMDVPATTVDGQQITPEYLQDVSTNLDKQLEQLRAQGVGNDLTTTTCDIIQNFKDVLTTCAQEGMYYPAALFAEITQHVAQAEEFELRATNAVGRGVLRFGKSALSKGKFAATHPVMATQKLGEHIAQTGLSLGKSLVVMMDVMGRAEQFGPVSNQQEAQQLHRDAVEFNRAVEQMVTRIRETPWEDWIEHGTEFTLDSMLLCGAGKLSGAAYARVSNLCKSALESLRIERELAAANGIVAPANACLEAIGAGAKVTAEEGAAAAAEIIEVVKANPALVEAEGGVQNVVRGVAEKKIDILGSRTGYRFKEGVDLDLRGSGKTYRDALDEAFRRTGTPKTDFQVTKWGNDALGKSHPVEWRAQNGAEVNIDLGHTRNGPDVTHIGYQTGGKRGSGGAVRGHIMVDDVPVNR